MATFRRLQASVEAEVYFFLDQEEDERQQAFDAEEYYNNHCPCCGFPYYEEEDTSAEHDAWTIFKRRNHVSNATYPLFYGLFK